MGFSDEDSGPASFLRPWLSSECYRDFGGTDEEYRACKDNHTDEGGAKICTGGLASPGLC